MSVKSTAVIAATAVAAVGATGALAWNLSGASDEHVPTPETAQSQTDPGVVSGNGEPRSAPDLATEFLAKWVDNGRVVRRDQGGDTVSEGQAYGMLLAAAIGDEKSFDEIWSWTNANLSRPDGLLAWKWSGGKVVDPEPASDADLDTARALVVAGDKFGRPELTTAGNTLGSAILDQMTVVTSVGRILLPGKWAQAAEPYAYNPSYASPAAFAILKSSSKDPRWAELQTGSAAVTTQLLSQAALPPDWAQVRANGQVEAMPGPAGRGKDVRYSYDAARLPLRYAESCAPGDVALAAQLAPTLERSDNLVASLDLGGGKLESATHPVSWDARAAAAAAAGDALGARSDLGRAIALSDKTPTYYGAAWVALAGMMLQTDLLGGCPAVKK